MSRNEAGDCSSGLTMKVAQHSSYACNVNGSRGDVDKEQDVMRDETLDRADFDAQEIGRRQTFPVSLQKRRPPGVRASLGSGFDPVLLRMLAMVPRPT